MDARKTALPCSEERLEQMRPVLRRIEAGDVTVPMTVIWQIVVDAPGLLATIDELRGVLGELVDLKDVKDTEGKTAEYLRRQPPAWEAARRARGGRRPSPVAWPPAPTLHHLPGCLVKLGEPDIWLCELGCPLESQ